MGSSPSPLRGKVIMHSAEQTGEPGEGPRFNAWLQGHINRPGSVGDLALEAWRDPNRPHDAERPDAMKRYLLEERGIKRRLRRSCPRAAA